MRSDDDHDDDLSRYPEIQAYLAAELASVPEEEVASLWADLQDARRGQSGFGGDTAEIYAYRLLPVLPHDPESDLSPALTESARDEQGRVAADHLGKVLRCLSALYLDDEFLVDGRPLEQGVVPLWHRVHVQVRPRPGVPPVVASLDTPDEDVEFVLVCVERDGAEAPVRVARLASAADLAVHALALYAPMLGARRRRGLLRGFLRVVEQEAVRELGPRRGLAGEDDLSAEQLHVLSLAVDEVGTQVTVSVDDLRLLLAEVLRRRVDAQPTPTPKATMLTAETIIDEQIRELLVEAPDVLTAQHCLVALGRCTYGHDADDGVAEARQYCANLMNSRSTHS